MESAGTLKAPSPSSASTINEQALDNCPLDEEVAQCPM